MVNKNNSIKAIILIITALFLFSCNKNATDTVINNTPISVTVIGDLRCFNCGTKEITEQLKNEAFLSWAIFTEQDFSQDEAKKYLIDNKITKLPAFVFSTNKLNDGNKMKPFLEELPNKSYLLNINAQFDPFIERSDRWFLVVNKDIISEIKKDSYIAWETNAKITWLEYSDIECPYCAKLHNSWTIETLMTTYSGSLNKIYNHFPLSFHKNALIGAQILECVGSEKWSDAFYELAKVSYAEENSTKSFLIDEAVKLWVDKKSLETCLENETFKEKVNKQMEVWSKTFWITGTPGNVIINNETGEYEILSWAVPTEYFVQVIDRLLETK